MTKKYIREMVRMGVARDITNAEFEKLPRLEEVGLSFGVYGMNGGLFEDNDGNLYAVTARNTLLFQLA